MKKKILSAIVLLAAVFAIYHRLSSGPEEGGHRPMGPAQVTVAEVIAKNIEEFREYAGRLEAVDRAEIKPRIDGVIEAVHFTEGSFVKKGDLLFTIDPRPFEAEVKRAEAALRSAQAQAGYAKNDLARAAPLMKDSFMAKRDYDTRHNNAQVTEAAVEAAEASLRTAKLNLEYTEIRAPIDGKVSRAEITSGNLVRSIPNAPLLTTIVALTPIYADFDMDEATYLIYVEAGLTGPSKVASIPVQVVLAGALPSETRKGYVKSFDNEVNTGSGTVRVRIQLDNTDSALTPGMFARIRIAVPREGKALLIAERAILTDQDRKIVYVVGKDNIVTPRVITPGGVAEGLRIVAAGLKEGESIVINGLQRVIPGAPVEPVRSSMDKAMEVGGAQVTAP